jgi:hypothetical protein
MASQASHQEKSARAGGVETLANDGTRIKFGSVALETT